MKPQKPIIDLKNVTVVQDSFKILRNISFEIMPGECCAIIGPNGAGKSALVAVISGYLWPQDGSVSVFGETFGEVDLQSVRGKIGIIEPSRMPHFDEGLTVRDVIATGLFGTLMLPFYRKITKQQWKKVDSQVSFFKLRKQASLPIGTLSSGEQTKVLIARAMISQPKMLILDEPTNALDMGNRAIVVKILNKLRKQKNPPAIVIISHHLDELPKSLDYAVLLKSGKIISQGKPQKVFTSANLSKTFGCKVRVLKNRGMYLASVQI
ncbi:MAG: ATP-binding cassette domain-containing protein [Planctomycetaceae bacterium]|nr:ATP-binding cassette domain-containing protein [Planctomycetaceae bacterium]